MFDPVLDAEGNTYERGAILEWFTQYGTSPISRQPLSENTLIPHNALRDSIHEVMGQQWVQQREQVCCKGDSKQSQPTRNRTAREKIESFLQLVDFGGLKLSLNERGCCAFCFNDNITVVLHVPPHGGTFVLYTRNLVAEITEQMKDMLLEMNFPPGDTRGGCLSVKKHPSGMSEVMFSYTDRVVEVSARDFRNIILNFVETASKVRTKLLQQEDPQTEDEDAAIADTSRLLNNNSKDAT